MRENLRAEKSRTEAMICGRGQAATLLPSTLLFSAVAVLQCTVYTVQYIYTRIALASIGSSRGFVYGIRGAWRCRLRVEPAAARESSSFSPRLYLLVSSRLGLSTSSFSSSSSSTSYSSISTITFIWRTQSQPLDWRNATQRNTKQKDTQRNRSVSDRTGPDRSDPNWITPSLTPTPPADARRREGRVESSR